MQIPLVLLLGMLLAGCQSLSEVAGGIERIGGATGTALGTVEGDCDGLDPYAPLVTSVRQSLAPGESSQFFTAHPSTKIELLEKHSNETIRLGHLLYVECWATNNNMKPDRAAYIEETYGRNKRAIIAG